MVSAVTLDYRARIEANRPAMEEVLRRYGVARPRLFGSTARGEAGADSDIDILAELTDVPGSSLLRVAGASQELTEILGVKVDLIVPEMVRAGVSESAMAEVVPL